MCAHEGKDRESPKRTKFLLFLVLFALSRSLPSCHVHYAHNHGHESYRALSYVYICAHLNSYVSMGAHRNVRKREKTQKTLKKWNSAPRIPDFLLVFVCFARFLRARTGFSCPSAHTTSLFVTRTPISFRANSCALSWGCPHPVWPVGRQRLAQRALKFRCVRYAH